MQDGASRELQELLSMWDSFWAKERPQLCHPHNRVPVREDGRNKLRVNRPKDGRDGIDVRTGEPGGRRKRGKLK